MGNAWPLTVRQTLHDNAGRNDPNWYWITANTVGAVIAQVAQAKGSTTWQGWHFCPTLGGRGKKGEGEGGGPRA